MDGDDAFERSLAALTLWRGECLHRCSFPHTGRVLSCSMQGERNGPWDHESGRRERRDQLHAPLHGIQPQEQDLTRDVLLNSTETHEQGGRGAARCSHLLTGITEVPFINSKTKEEIKKNYQRVRKNSAFWPERSHEGQMMPSRQKSSKAKAPGVRDAPHPLTSTAPHSTAPAWHRSKRQRRKLMHSSKIQLVPF